VDSVLLSALATERLRKSGWFPGRDVAADEACATLKSEGYDVPAVVVAFLREFDGLSCAYAYHTYLRQDELFQIDAKAAALDVWPSYVRRWAAAVGESLIPIGEVFSQATVVMSESGKVFAGFESTLVQLGESGYDAINALCECRKRQPFETPPIAE